MALNMNKSKAYPLPKELEDYGKSICLVRNPRAVIERIQEAKLETWKDLKERIDPWLRDRIARTWGLKTGRPAS